MKDFLSLIKNYYYYYKWIFEGREIPPQTLFKRKRLNTISKKYDCKIFVETGTADGKTIKYLHKNFENLYSIEVYEPNYHIATERNAGFENVEILLGDSAKLLPAITHNIKKRTLFWLDGHYSGVGTGKSDKNCPVLMELEAIKAMVRNDNIILIDDSRLFVGENDYPKVDKVIEVLKQINPMYNIEISFDCIIATI